MTTRIPPPDTGGEYPSRKDDTDDFGDVFVVSPAGPESTPPEATPVVSPAPDGSGGWCTGTPTFRWRLIESESNVTGRTGSDPVTIGVDTHADGTVYTCTATSSVGTTEESVTIRRDGTAPTITGSVAPSAPDGENGWYVTSPAVGFTCNDACPASLTAPEA